MLSRPSVVLKGFHVCKLDIKNVFVLFAFCYQVDCSEEAELCQSFGVSCFGNSLFTWELHNYKPRLTSAL